MTTATEKQLRHLKTFSDLKAAIASLEARIADDKAKARKSRALRKERAPTPPGKPIEQRRADHAASTTDLRVAAWIRCGGTVRWEIPDDPDATDAVPVFEGPGRCEVSGVEFGSAWEMHHLDGGGNRRSHQSLDNVLAVSWEVHRLIHRGDLATLNAVKVACIRIGMREGLRAVEHRIAKVEEARSCPS